MYSYRKSKVLTQILVALIFLASCKETVYNGSYCSTVQYYNKNTGTQSDYTLYVEVDRNVLKEIRFPSGYLNQENFGYVQITSGGKGTAYNDKGYEYHINITGSLEGCLDNVPNATQCNGTTKTGRRCKNLTDNESGFCWHHNK